MLRYNLKDVTIIKMKYKPNISKTMGCFKIEFNDIDIIAVLNGSVLSFTDPELYIMVRLTVSDVDSAVDAFKDYLISKLGYNAKFFVSGNHGGKRVGSGRKQKPPTKPVRLNEREQAIIENFRSSNVDEFKLAKMLIRLMADIENNADNY